MRRPTVEPHEVPQATLARVRAVIDARAGGALTAASIGGKANLSPRHVSYALAAGRSLGLLEGEHDGPRLTPLGIKMAGVMQGSEDERLVFLEAIAGSRVMSAVAPQLCWTGTSGSPT